ncbi:MAG: macro domain-containing protein [Anaerolineales bacterium]|nr:MAG: macro domain-containing protein [Anaerolineales bacterium]
MELVHGDITRSRVDAVVNAANTQLQHGGGVAGAIARYGGPDIQSESDAWVRKHGPISHDKPALTSGGILHCQHVIHTVGPIWGEGDEDHKLECSVQSALRLADQLGCKSVALPAISTGIFGFPIDRGARVILDAMIAYLQSQSDGRLRRIAITLIDKPGVDIFAAEFDVRWGNAP